MKALSYLWWLCLAAICGGAPSPKRQGVDVEKTVAQVEEVLRQNVNLPRLSREDILQLLNDIRAEDERSASFSAERTANIESASKEGQSSERERDQIEFNEISDEIDQNPSLDLTPAGTSQDRTTIRPSSRPESLMVVLPYTPRDGSSLQELYTRPPRVALLRAPAPMRTTHNRLIDMVKEESKDSPSVPQTVQPLVRNSSFGDKAVAKDAKKIKGNLTKLPEAIPSLEMAVENTSSFIGDIEEHMNGSGAPIQLPVEYPDVSSELRDFLQSHGLHGNAGAPEDHFLLPLDGFKPLPPVREIDGTIDLPENILLTYDLVSPPSEELYSGGTHPDIEAVDLPPETYIYEPLRPELPFELDAFASEAKKTVVPLDAPNRKRKAVDDASPNYSPVEYDSVKVIPLQTGPDPLSFNSEQAELDVQKRQSDNSTTTTESSSTETVSEEVTTVVVEEVTTTTSAPERDSSVADSSPSGPSIADLESSFGAPAPIDESEAQLPPPRKNGFYWMLDWNSFLEVGDGDEKVNIRFEPKLGDPQMFLPVSVP